jgi:peptidoglycan/LPS O-acetylase OafA/YrhL
LAQNRSSLACLLSLRPVVLLGKLSYSLYLWHLPLLIYAEYWAVNPIRWPFRIGLLLLSILFAMASWKLVEIPFRTRRVLSGRRPTFAFGAASQALVLLVGVVIVIGHGNARAISRACRKVCERQIGFCFPTER